MIKRDAGKKESTQFRLGEYTKLETHPSTLFYPTIFMLKMARNDRKSRKIA